MCSIMTLFLVVSGAFAMTTAQRKVRFENCTEGGEAIRSLVVTPCSSDPCVVPVGSGINISFELLSNQDSINLRLDPRVQLLGMELPILGVERDACKLTTTACPVSEGQLIQGTVPVHVNSFVPPVSAVTIWRVHGDKGLMACGTTTVTVSRT
ncbi:mite group 2 allergen-like Ixo r 2 [Dermacentor andersoni]|uniref:mite group 2 allergen-like Ixo r 2 n=1 Tax=Dermacentor andersoni TaxID=34620 RepID=UPI002155CF89|nr:mite group 2 allergen-like Ixo r 2 [Dermacentor andersoni]